MWLTTMGLRVVRALAETQVGKRLTWEAMDALGVERIEMRRGGQCFAGTVRDKMITYELFKKGQFDKVLIDFATDFAARYRDDDQQLAFIDIGANNGTNTVYALQHGRFVSAICFEPDPENFESLRRTINGCNLTENVVSKQYGLGDQNFEAVFCRSGDNFGDHRVSASDVGEQRVEICRFDELDVNSTYPIGLVSLDVQGYEAKALAGATTLTSQDVPLLCEIQPEQLSEHGDLDNLIGLLQASYGWLSDPWSKSPAEPVSALQARIERIGVGGHADLLFTKRRPPLP